MQQQSDYPTYDPSGIQPAKRGMSTGAKWAIGCSASTVLALILICGGIFFVGRYFLKKAEAMAKQYESQGYARVTGQVIDITQPVTQPTVFMGQAVNIRANSNSDVAILAQAGLIDAQVDGNVDFYGQSLTIGPKGVIKGNVVIKGAQVVTVTGRVEGTVTGTYQAMNVTGTGKVVGNATTAPGKTVTSKPAGP